MWPNGDFNFVGDSEFDLTGFGFFQVFDISRKLTYINLKTWYSEMREHCPDIPCIVVANKIDSNGECVSW